MGWKELSGCPSPRTRLTVSLRNLTERKKLDSRKVKQIQHKSQKMAKEIVKGLKKKRM